MTDEPAPSGGVNADAPTARHSPVGSRRFWLRGMIGFAVVVTVVWLVFGRIRPAHLPLPAGITEAEFSRASKAWKQKYQRRPDDLDVLSWLAESAVAAGNLEVAAACFEKIPSTHAVYGRSARHQQGQVLQKLNRLCAAEKNLQEFIALESKSARPQKELLIDGMQRMRSLLELELRFEERHALLSEMINFENVELFDTLAFLFPSLLRWNGPEVIGRAESALAAEPDCFEVRRAIGRFRTGQGRLDEARTILDECLREAPNDLATIAYVLECEQERGGTGAIAEAVRRLPPVADSDPWLLLEIRGQVHIQDRQFLEAIDCFDRILRADPTNTACHQGIADCCLALGQTDRRQRALRAADLLTHLQSRVGLLASNKPAPEPLVEIARSCEELDLINHALAIARQGQRLYRPSGEFDALVDRLQRSDRAAPSTP